MVVETNGRKSGTALVMIALILPIALVALTSFLSEPSEAGSWGSRVLVTDDPGDSDWSAEAAVATDRFGNVHVVWSDGDLDGSGPDSDIFYRKWNATTQLWESRVLITDDFLNNTDNSDGPDVESDRFGNVHVVWRQKGDIGGSGTDTDIFWRMWDADTGAWNPRELVSDDPDDGGSSAAVRLASDMFGNIHATWHDKAALNASAGIQYRKWNGSTGIWEERMMVSENSTEFLWSDVAVDPFGNVHIAWNDRANLSGASSNGLDYDIFYRKLDASSTVFGPVYYVTEDDQTDEYGSNMDRIIADSFGNVHIVWWESMDQDGGGSGIDDDIFYRKWNAITRIWENRVLISNDPANTGSSADARMCSDPLGNLHIAWRDKSDVDGAGSNYGDLLHKKWDVITSVWEGTKALTNDLLDQYLVHYPDVACDNLGNVVVVWNDMSGLLGSGPDYDVYLRKYESGIVLPDYVPVEVSPSPAEWVLTGSETIISARVYNGGNASSITSTVAFYNSSTPGSPFFQNSAIPSLGMAERSPPNQAIWKAPQIPGTYEVTIEVDYGNSIIEVSELNNFYRIEFIVDTPPLPLTPPTNLTTQVVNVDDILLNWTAPNSISIDHYRIYRSTDQREFDFSTPTYNTSTDVDPLRTNWTDANAANESAPTEYYYVVRTVNSFGMKSITSNTAGKWTSEYPEGLSAFSLPLESFVVRNVSWFSENIPGTEFVRWMSSSGHWVTHYPSMGVGVMDVPVVMGRAYEISLSSSTNFTFCGYPASMIRFHEGFGDSLAFRKSLSARTEGNDVNLSWGSVAGASEYLIFRSDRREGLHNLSLSPIANTTETYWIDLGIIKNQTSEHYYLVIPSDSKGEMGSSTYSTGVFTLGHQTGSETFALPLKPVEVHSLDWYCDNIPGVVGMGYVIHGVWKFHAKDMPEGVYDVSVAQSEGFQISIDGTATRFTFIGY
ncbi:MAG: hypothetical protein KAR39_12045 [Thermoplasmata archaeon]|nr:hypothetical protein [Thermoplasmata archaeon]